MIPTLIITRPQPQGDAFAQQIQHALDGKLRVILSPLLQIVPVAADIPNVSGVILTSVNAAQRAAMLCLDKGLPAFCVGKKTAAAAITAGFQAIVGPGDARSLAQMIIETAPQGPLVHLRGKHARGDITQVLTHAGIACHDVVVYDQQALELTTSAKNALSGENPVVLPLFSARTGAILSGYGPFAAPLHVVAISAAAITDLHVVTSVVAVQPDGNAMVDATVACLRGLLKSRDA